MKNLISQLESLTENPRKGLPDDLFYFVGRVTPFVNVDLLLRDNSGKVLFTWRDDPHSGIGWHLPGGIIRFQESWLSRVRKVAETEIGVTLDGVYGPSAINELIDLSTKERSHFISLLFDCTIDSTNNLYLQKKCEKNPHHFLLSHGVPENLLPKHRIYSTNILQK
jgi:ADP-ribose pyrophosphatase YjhB (NUDIX family)